MILGNAPGSLNSDSVNKTMALDAQQKVLRTLRVSEHDRQEGCVHSSAMIVTVTKPACVLVCTCHSCFLQPDLLGMVKFQYLSAI